MPRVRLYWLPSCGYLAANVDSGNVVHVPIKRGGWQQRTAYTGTLAVLRPEYEVSEAVLVAVAHVTGMPTVIGDDEPGPTLPVGRALAEVQLLAGILAQEAGRMAVDGERASGYYWETEADRQRKARGRRCWRFARC